MCRPSEAVGVVGSRAEEDERWEVDLSGDLPDGNEGSEPDFAIRFARWREEFSAALPGEPVWFEVEVFPAFVRLRCRSAGIARAHGEAR